MSNRAQAAMEFLMTYGWALLVVIIVIAALAFFGLLNPANFLPDKLELGQGLAVKDFIINGTGIIMIITNGLGRDISSLKFNITNCNNNLGTLSPSTSIVDGATTTVYVACPGLVSKSKFRSDIIVNYSATSYGMTLSHLLKGRIVSATPTINLLADGAACSWDSQCNSGVCGGASSTCLAIGSTALLGTCTAGNQCKSGFCDTSSNKICTNGSVGLNCAASADCRQGRCSFGNCVTGLAGAVCSADSDCSPLSGAIACVNYICTLI